MISTDRNKADPSTFSGDATAANLLVKDRAISANRLLNADCGTLKMWTEKWESQRMQLSM